MSENIADAAIQYGIKKEKVFRNANADPESISHSILQILRPNDVLLVKGSRAMKMEEIIEKIKPSLIQKEEKIKEKERKREGLLTAMANSNCEPMELRKIGGVV